MTQYLLAVHTGNAAAREMSPEDMQESFRQIGALEADMKTSGAWVFSGRLHDPDTATVVRESDGTVITTDGPYVESKEHLGGFYIIEAQDLDGALAWASRVTSATSMPIEIRPFSFTGELKDALEQASGA
ncbi:MAG TPA: YciI family protein [Solirubrobacteraceae bacterium]|jgi:hypothetical protein|nr:YciI family protein [Solirubrobacteraceae bacterium]